MRRFSTSLLLGLMLLVTATVGHAETTVLFENGRSLQVSGVERTEQTALLTLAEGGQITVPANRIVNWPDLDGLRSPELVRDRNIRTRTLTEDDLLALVEHAAERHGLDPALLIALARVEAARLLSDVSPETSQSPLGLAPEIAHRAGVSAASDPDRIVEAAASHLDVLLDRYDGRTDLALAAYNAGVEAVNRHRGVPPYERTRQFVDRVLELTAQDPHSVSE